MNWNGTFFNEVQNTIKKIIQRTLSWWLDDDSLEN